MSLLNTGTSTVADYLLDRVAIVDNEIIFKVDTLTEHNPTIYQSVRRVRVICWLLTDRSFGRTAVVYTINETTY